MVKQTMTKTKLIRYSGNKNTSSSLDILLFGKKEEHCHSTLNSFSLQPLTLFRQNLPESHEFFVFLSQYACFYAETKKNN